MAGPWERYQKQGQEGPWIRYQQPSQPSPDQPSATADAFSSFAAGVGRGAADLVGLPGTLANLSRDALQWGMRKGYGAVTGQAPDPYSESGVERFFAGATPEVESALWFGGRNPLSGESLRSGLSTVTGGATDYQPQTTAGKYTRTVGEFLPSAMTLGGGGLLNALRYGVVPALTSETAGQMTEGTAWEPYARVAGALGGGWLGSKLARPAPQSLPSAAEIKRSAGYGDQMNDMLRNARTTDRTYSNIVRDLWDDVKQAGTSYEVQQNFGRTLQNEARLVQQEGASLHSLERLRRALRSAGGGKLDTPNNAIANRLIDKLDTAVDSLSASNIAATGQTGRPVLDVLKEARAVYRTGKKAQIIEEAIGKAQNAASGFENGLKNEFRKLLKPEVAKNFSNVEKQAIQDVVLGGFKANAARFLGTFGFPVDQARNWLGATAGGGLGGTIGGKIGGPTGAFIGGLSVPVVGTAFKSASNQITRNQAALAEALVKSGPQGVSAAQASQAARQVAGREAIARALLQSQSAAQVPYAREYAR